MMPATYEPIATTTLTGASGAINFTSIPSTYTDLRIVLFSIGTTNGTDNYCAMRFNNDTGNNYSYTTLQGNGANITSSRGTSQNNILLQVTYTAASGSNPALYEIDIFNYAGSNKKTVLSRFSADGNGAGVVNRQVNLWNSTATITTVNLICFGVSWAAGTTATLYGIKAA